MIRVFDHYVPTRTVMELGADFSLLTLAGMASGATLLLLSGTSASLADALPVIRTPALAYSCTMLLLFVAFGVYQRERGGSLRLLLLSALMATFVSVGPLFFVLLHLAIVGVHPLRFLALAYVLQFAGLVLIRQPLLGAHTRRLWSSKLLVVGCGPDAQAVASDIQQRGHGAYQLVGFYPSARDETAAPQLPAPLFCNADDLATLADAQGIDEIVVAVRDQRGGVLPLRQLLECRTRGVRVHSMAAFSERLNGEVPLDSLKASWLIYGNGFAQGWLRTTVKRLFDISASLVLLALSWWLMLLAALAIFIEDGGPVLFRQQRVGRSGRLFSVLKFRSMRTDAEKDGVARWAQANDSRVTRVGRFIRKTRIDELPQLLNVLRGEMSLVGPRPERPGFVEQLTEQIPFYAIRHSVKPGLTGWAQVRFSYGASLADARRKLQFDLYYVKNHSLVLDLQIILETVRVVLLGEGAR